VQPRPHFVCRLGARRSELATSSTTLLETCPKSMADCCPLTESLSVVATSRQRSMTSRRKAECRAERDRGLERETGLEPATFSLEGLDLYAVWLPSWKGVHFVSSYRVVV
jgi:hypothetical protein